MDLNEQNSIWIIGHKNPDTDSICAAISYAYLKNQIDSRNYIPKRAGDLNEETKYVLRTFGVEEPELVKYAGAQVKDTKFRKTKGVSRNISLKKAWEMLKELDVATLPVTNDDNDLVGVIITKDIATSYMDVYDSNMLAKTSTKFCSIAETLDGEIICGDPEDRFDSGKVAVGSANPEVMEEFINGGDLVIMGSRYEAQFCAIELNVRCIVITGAPKISKTILQLAKDRGVVLITTPYDTFIASRLINQSMPISSFMKSEDLYTFDLDEYIDDVRDVMTKVRHRDFPVLDEDGKYVGMISRRNLLSMHKKQLILVDHNEKSQAVDGIDEADILEIIDHHRIGSLETLAPVFFRNQPLGCTATIIYKMYHECGQQIPPQIAGLLCSAIISDTLMYRSPTCTPEDVAAAEDLASIAGISVEEHAKGMFSAGSNFKDKTADEIIHQDFKIFAQGETEFGVAQLSAMTRTELTEVAEKVIPYLNTALSEHKIDMLFVMLTNILEENTCLLCTGDGAEELIRDTYHQEPEPEGFVLKGVVSRKKQLIPALMAALAEN